jgi:hypothetical protein
MLLQQIYVFVLYYGTEGVDISGLDIFLAPHGLDT